MTFLIECCGRLVVHLYLHCAKGVKIWNFFWSVFFRIWTEYGDLLCKFPYSVQMWENLDQKKLVFSHSEKIVFDL